MFLSLVASRPARIRNHDCSNDRPCYRQPRSWLTSLLGNTQPWRWIVASPKSVLTPVWFQRYRVRFLINMLSGPLDNIIMSQTNVSHYISHGMVSGFRARKVLINITNPRAGESSLARSLQIIGRSHDVGEQQDSSGPVTLPQSVNHRGKVT